MLYHPVLRDPELVGHGGPKVETDNALTLQVQVEEAAVVHYVVVALKKDMYFLCPL